LSLNQFIPTLWADTMLVTLRKSLVFGNLFNTDWSGQIQRQGDTVKINGIGPITISSYSKDTSINAPQSLTDAQTQLTISQASYYNFAIDDVDAAQQEPKVMAQAMSDAGYYMADTMDQYYAGFYTDAATANLIGSSSSWVTPVVGTQANIGNGTTVYDYLVQLGQKLTEAKITRQGRWCVVPPWITTFLTQDTRFTSFNTPEARLAIKTGNLDASNGLAADAYIGQIANMDIYESINTPHLGGTVGVAGSQDVIIAGHRMGLAKAEGLTETEAYRPPDRFSDAVKGLALYGAKTVRPDAIAVAYLQHP
jgi:hypothetical protein